MWPILPKSKALHNLRLTEAETAFDMGVPIEDWYEMAVEAREQLIAARLARSWIDNLDALEMSKKR